MDDRSRALRESSGPAERAQFADGLPAGLRAEVVAYCQERRKDGSSIRSLAAAQGLSRRPGCALVSKMSGGLSS